jgi:hypothetical protein
VRDAVWFSERPVAKRAPVVLDAEGRTVVNLSSEALVKDGPTEQQVMDQLRWSLRLVVAGPVELQIEGQHQDVDGESPGFHNAYPGGLAAYAEMFGVDRESGKVVVDPDSPPGTRPPSVLTAEANEGVFYAAISLDHRHAAFVRRNGRQLVIIHMGDSGPGRPINVTGLPSGIGRPVWIPGSEDRLVVPASGRLYVVDREGGVRRLAADLTGVTSVSVSSDGRRVAYAADGRAYVAALRVGRPDVSLDTTGRRMLVTRLLRVRAVAWDSDTQVLLAGADGDRAALYRSTVDGGILTQEVQEEVVGGLTDIVAFANRPLGGTGGDMVARIDSDAFTVYPYPNTLEPMELATPFYAGP